MERYLQSESYRLNFHGQPNRQVRMKIGPMSFLFRMTMADLLFMHEDSAANAGRSQGMLPHSVIDQSGLPASPEIVLKQGDTIRFGRSPQFEQSGRQYFVSIENAQGAFDMKRTMRLASPAVQALVSSDSHISRNHATIDVMTPDIVVVNDLGSVNSTILTYIGI